MATLTRSVTAFPASAASDAVDMEIHSVRATRRRSYFTRLFTLAGVIGSILFVLVFIIDGFLRPGYSPIQQAISDLGVGQNAWILNTDLIAFGLLSMLYVIGFYQAIRKSIGRRMLKASTSLLLLAGAGAVNDGFFTEYNPTDPNAALHDALHSLGFLVAFGSLTIALFIIGLQLWKDRVWRGYRWYSLITSLVTLLLIILPYAFPQYGAQFGGLNERMLLVEALAWQVVTGCRLFAYERFRSGGIDDALGADNGRKWPFPFMTLLTALPAHITHGLCNEIAVSKLHYVDNRH